MPKITIDIGAGRTLEQKRKLVEGITNVVSEVAAVPKDAVHIVIHENTYENIALGGILFCDR